MYVLKMSSPKATISLLVFFSIFYQSVKLQECAEPTFNHTIMFTKVGDEERTISIKDCVLPGMFPYTITDIRAFDPVYQLKNGAFSDMFFLKRISFSRNCIRAMSPGAFRRLPRLNAIELDRNRLQEVPNGVFNNLKVAMLQLDHNDIKSIASLAFSNMSRLEQIDLSHNRLEFWSANWFSGSTELRAVYFAHNRIRTVPTRAFANLPKLQSISFKSNEITHIEPNAFEGLSILETLDLSNNNLKQINTDTFSGDITIETLYLSNNKLCYLSEALLTKLTLSYIYLENNPWQCPCLDRINVWMLKNSVTLTSEDEIADSPVCVYRKTNSRICIEEIDDESSSVYFNALGDTKPIKQSEGQDRICLSTL